MMENDKRCAFAVKKINSCRILTVGKCDGFDTACKFRKTKAQLKVENDRCIDRCRAFGRCAGCRYRGIPCKKSDEK